MRPETIVKRLFIEARTTALKVLAADAKLMLPEGWRVILAVGWGFIVYDDKGKRVCDDDEPLPSKTPAGARPFINAAATFFDLFGPGNEILSSKGLRYK